MTNVLHARSHNVKQALGIQHWRNIAAIFNDRLKTDEKVQVYINNFDSNYYSKGLR